MDKLLLSPAWIVFPKVNIEAVPEHDTDESVEDLQINLSSSTSQDKEHTIQINIGLSNNDHIENNLPYKLDVHVYATFDCNTDLYKLADKARKEIATDISTMLIGSLREIISSITSRAPWGTYIVPFISHEQLAENIIADLVKVHTSKKKKPIKKEH